MVAHICAKFRVPTRAAHRRSMSATRPPAADHQTLAPFGQVDQLRPAVGGIGPAAQVAEFGEIVDELRRGGQAELRAVRQLRQPDTAGSDVAEDLQVRLAHVPVPGLGTGSGKVVAEFAKQPDQQLPDGQPAPGGSLDSATTPRILRLPKFRFPK